jgi:Fanconi-associated nuclease 1
VEEIALQYYVSNEGWKGFHVENGIMATLFSLLFWDILFAGVPGVFQTPYQTAPLDLCSEFFWTSREASILLRIKEIGDGQSVPILVERYSEEAVKKTLCIGVSWDFSLNDLVEIAEVS